MTKGVSDSELRTLLERLRNELLDKRRLNVDNLALFPSDPERWQSQIERLLSAKPRRTLNSRISFGAEIPCLQCRERCQHGQPEHPDEVLLGYTPNGKPRFENLLQSAIQHAPDLAERICDGTDSIAALLSTPISINDPLLPEVKQRLQSRILGIVQFGYLGEGVANGSARISCSLILSRDRDGQYHFLALSKGDAFRYWLWDGARQGQRGYLQRVFKKIEGWLRQLDRVETRRARRVAEDKFLRRVSDEINLYKRRRGKRTEHARQRHAQGQRPTREAFRDAASLRDGSLYVDTRRSTYVVLGPQRRAHMFSRQGRHVTSFRLAEGELERKCRRERWRLASSTMYQEFRNLIELKDK